MISPKDDSQTESPNFEVPNPIGFVEMEQVKEKKGNSLSLEIPTNPPKYNKDDVDSDTIRSLDEELSLRGKIFKTFGMYTRFVVELLLIVLLRGPYLHQIGMSLH